MAPVTRAKKRKIEREEESTDSSNSETSFMDLPDDVIRNITKFLDLPSRLNLRVNKRLDRLHFSTKNNLKCIQLNVRSTYFKLKLDNHTQVRSANFNKCEKALRRFALNTSVNRIFIILERVPHEHRNRMIEALFHFKADSLMITVLEGCRMKSFDIQLAEGMGNAFIKECFGVTIQTVPGPLRGTIYRSTDESLEMYREHIYCSLLEHFEGNFRTISIRNRLCFNKLDVVTKPDDDFKIKWNHLYQLRLII